jgi:RNA polymerase sigma-70 factor (ECF subfamily)
MLQKPWEVDVTYYGDEGQLLEGLRRHEAAACTCVLKRFAPRLYRLALQLVADPDEAEDVLQESLILACSRIDSFEGRSELYTWLHRIVLNTALMRVRQRSPQVTSLDRTRRADDGQAQGLSRELPTSITTGGRAAQPSAAALDRELGEIVDRAVLALPGTLRSAFVLRAIEGLSTRQAAAALGISESALKVRLHRARSLLHDALQPYLDESAAPAE